MTETPRSAPCTYCGAVAAQPCFNRRENVVMTGFHATRWAQFDDTATDGMTAIDDATRRKFIGLIVQAMERSLHGCEGGAFTDRVGAQTDAIEQAEARGDLDTAWQHAMTWLGER